MFGQYFDRTWHNLSIHYGFFLHRLIHGTLCFKKGVWMCKCVVFQFICRKTKRFSYSDDFYNNNRRKQFSDRTKTNWCQFTILVATRQMKRTITGFFLSDMYTVFANLPRLMIQMEPQCLQFVQKVLLILQCFLRIYFMLIISIIIICQ